MREREREREGGIRKERENLGFGLDCFDQEEGSVGIGAV